MSFKRLRLPLPADPRWNEQERQVALVVARIAYEAVATYCEHEEQGMPMMRRRMLMAPLLAQWIDAVMTLSSPLGTRS